MVILSTPLRKVRCISQTSYTSSNSHQTGATTMQAVGQSTISTPATGSTPECALLPRQMAHPHSNSAHKYPNSNPTINSNNNNMTAHTSNCNSTSNNNAPTHFVLNSSFNAPHPHHFLHPQHLHQRSSSLNQSFNALQQAPPQQTSTLQQQQHQQYGQQQLAFASQSPSTHQHHIVNRSAIGNVILNTSNYATLDRPTVQIPAPTIQSVSIKPHNITATTSHMTPQKPLFQPVLVNPQSQELVLLPQQQQPQQQQQQQNQQQQQQQPQQQQQSHQQQQQQQHSFNASTTNSGTNQAGNRPLIHQQQQPQQQVLFPQSRQLFPTSGTATASTIPGHSSAYSQHLNNHIMRLPPQNSLTLNPKSYLMNTNSSSTSTSNNNNNNINTTNITLQTLQSNSTQQNRSSSIDNNRGVSSILAPPISTSTLSNHANQQQQQSNQSKIQQQQQQQQQQLSQFQQQQIIYQNQQLPQFSNVLSTPYKMNQNSVYTSSASASASAKQQQQMQKQQQQQFQNTSPKRPVVTLASINTTNSFSNTANKGNTEYLKTEEIPEESESQLSFQGRSVGQTQPQPQLQQPQRRLRVDMDARAMNMRPSDYSVIIDSSEYAYQSKSPTKTTPTIKTAAAVVAALANSTNNQLDMSLLNEQINENFVLKERNAILSEENKELLDKLCSLEEKVNRLLIAQRQAQAEEEEKSVHVISLEEKATRTLKNQVEMLLTENDELRRKLSVLIVTHEKYVDSQAKVGQKQEDQSRKLITENTQLRDLLLSNSLNASQLDMKMSESFLHSSVPQDNHTRNQQNDNQSNSNANANNATSTTLQNLQHVQQQQRIRSLEDQVISLTRTNASLSSELQNIETQLLVLTSERDTLIRTADTLTFENIALKKQQQAQKLQFSPVKSQVALASHSSLDAELEGMYKTQLKAKDVEIALLSEEVHSLKLKCYDLAVQVSGKSTLMQELEQQMKAVITENDRLVGVLATPTRTHPDARLNTSISIANIHNHSNNTAAAVAAINNNEATSIPNESSSNNKLTQSDYRIITEMEAKVQELVDENDKLCQKAEQYKQEADAFRRLSSGPSPQRGRAAEHLPREMSQYQMSQSQYSLHQHSQSQSQSLSPFRRNSPSQPISISPIVSLPKSLNPNIVVAAANATNAPMITMTTSQYQSSHTTPFRERSSVSSAMSDVKVEQQQQTDQSLQQQQQQQQQLQNQNQNQRVQQHNHQHQHSLQQQQLSRDVSPNQKIRQLQNWSITMPAKTPPSGGVASLTQGIATTPLASATYAQRLSVSSVYNYASGSRTPNHRFSLAGKDGVF